MTAQLQKEREEIDKLIDETKRKGMVLDEMNTEIEVKTEAIQSDRDMLEKEKHELEKTNMNLLKSKKILKSNLLSKQKRKKSYVGDTERERHLKEMNETITRQIHDIKIKRNK